MAFAIIALAVAACIAGIIPARRAASIDPVQALRTDKFDGAETPPMGDDS
jgi:macrolide transport system ATP-binding/permease protein